MSKLDRDRLITLIGIYVQSRSSGQAMDPSDLADLLDWSSENEDNRIFLERATEPGRPEAALKEMEYIDGQLESAISLFHARLRERERGPLLRRLLPWTAAAACVIGIVLISIHALRTNEHAPVTTGAEASRDIDPGGDRAILTLADGSKIALDSAGNGILARQGSTKVIKLDASQLAYNTNPQKPSVPIYNTISTPKGGQYQVVLSDGTHVWLNAASSLTFPTAFPNSTRSVTLTGEGYFEVAAMKSVPFIVHTAKTSIQVLGTHFNVSAYPDEPIQKTTLLEGAVRVAEGSKEIVLRPGEEAQSRSAEGLTLVKDEDAEQAVAWKDGMFDFEHVGLYSAMRQIARWYNIEVIYEGTVPDKALFGSLHRNTKLSMILSLLRRVDVRCRMEGRTVYITP